MWLLGVVAIIWTLDCFVGFYLTLPVAARPIRAARPPYRQLARGWWARWEPAWRIKTTGSPYRITFDIHRAFGLWTWALLFILAFTAFSLNLYREVFYPVMSLVSEVTPTPFDVREPADTAQPIEPLLGYADVIDRARAEAAAAGLGGAGGGRLLQPGVRHLRRGLLPARRRSRAAGVGPAELYYRRPRRPAARRPGALAGHRRRHLRPGPVPAAQRPHPGPARPHPDLAHGPGRRRALGHRRGDLGAQAPRTAGGGPAQAPARGRDVRPAGRMTITPQVPSMLKLALLACCSPAKPSPRPRRPSPNRRYRRSTTAGPPAEAAPPGDSSLAGTATAAAPTRTYRQ